MNRSATVRTCCGIALALVLVAIIGKASAYVDLAPTLAKIISDAKLIAVVELSSFDKDTGVVNLKAVRALKGAAPSDLIHHHVTSTSKGTIAAQVARWIEPAPAA